MTSSYAVLVCDEEGVIGAKMSESLNMTDCESFTCIILYMTSNPLNLNFIEIAPSINVSFANGSNKPYVFRYGLTIRREPRSTTWFYS